MFLIFIIYLARVILNCYLYFRGFLINLPIQFLLFRIKKVARHLFLTHNSKFVYRFFLPEIMSILLDFLPDLISIVGFFSYTNTFYGYVTSLIETKPVVKIIPSAISKYIYLRPFLHLLFDP